MKTMYVTMLITVETTVMKSKDVQVAVYGIE